MTRRRHARRGRRRRDGARGSRAATRRRARRAPTIAYEPSGGRNHCCPNCTIQRVERDVDRAGRAEHAAAAGRGTPSSPARVMHEARHAEARCRAGRRCRPGDGTGDDGDQRSRAMSGQPQLHEGDGEDRRGEPADRADREVDLAEQQHEHDADRHRADRGALHGQVDEVGARQEGRVEDLEDRRQMTTSPTITGIEPRSPVSQPLDEAFARCPRTPLVAQRGARPAARRSRSRRRRSVPGCELAQRAVTASCRRRR